MKRDSVEAGGKPGLSIAGLGLLIVIAVSTRAAIAVSAPGLTYDSRTYYVTAQNIVLNGCVSASAPESGACIPSWGGNHLPGYPIFIAGVFKIAPGSVAAVLVAQSLVTGLALLWFVTGVWHFTKQRTVTLAVGWLCGLSLATFPWARMMLLECLLATCSLWLIGSLLRLMAGGRLPFFGIAMPLICAAFLRPDSLLLAIPVAIVVFLKRPPLKAFLLLLALGLTTAAPIAAWVIRSLRLELPPVPLLAVPEGFRQPVGSFALMKTWLVYDDQLREWHWPVLSARYDNMTLARTDLVPGSEEYQRVARLVQALRQHTGQEVPEHIDRQFGEIAAQRKAAAPFRYRIVVPLKRAWSLWTDPTPVSGNGWPTSGNWNILSNAATAWRAFIPLIVLVTLIPRRLRPSQSMHVLALAGAVFLIIRTGFLAVAGFPEPRYLIPVLPFMEVVAAYNVASAFAWRRSALPQSTSESPSEHADTP